MTAFSALAGEDDPPPPPRPVVKINQAAVRVGPVAPVAGEKDKDKDKKEKDKDKNGPDHNVTLLEEPGANDLFNRAKKARTAAEKNPELWPDCVKHYADILKKYPNSVYLEKWEGPENTEPAYKNGLYRSVRERVAAELATLPANALAVYRVTYDPPARALFVEGQQQFDERKMEQAARDYFLTSWGDNALAWLSESSYERGAVRESLTRAKRAQERPGTVSTPTGLLARELLAQIKLGEKASAEKTLAALEESLKDPQKGALRIGHDEGSAALDKLKSRVAGMKGEVANLDAKKSDEDASRWETYFGTPTHNKQAQPRPSNGLRTWSARIDDLLYGKGVVNKDDKQQPVDDPSLGPTDPSMNQQLTISNGYFHINDAQVYAAYPTAEPKPGGLAAQGNALYQLPPEGVKSPPNKRTTSGNPRRAVYYDGQQQNPIIQHPYFSTLANGRAYGVLGVENAPAGPNDRMNGIRFIRGPNRVGDEDAKGPSNYLVCFGKKDNAAETSLLWSLKPGEAAFNAQSKADQDWLKGVYFATAPTYDNGSLYVMTVQISPSTLDAFAASFDANNGRLLWRTQICSGQPITFMSRVQPDRGLPVAVANRTVFIVTNLGAVAALDAGSGAVKWIRVYDRVKTSQQNMWGIADMCQNHDIWAPNPPIVYENSVIVTPQDSEWIYSYNIETGARKWEMWRYREDIPHRPDARGLRHVLGIVDNTLVLSGEDVRFVNLRNGHRAHMPVAPESPIRGRGAVTANQILFSTEAGLATINILKDPKAQKNTPFELEEGTEIEPATKQPKVKINIHPWTDAKEEAGSIYAADGVLYTVSHTHVNAYIVWQELENKLKEQIAAKPDDLDLHVKLAGVYKNIERFDAALSEIDAGLVVAKKHEGEAKMGEKLTDLRTRRFDALMSLGNKLAAENKNADAFARFKEAAELAATPGLPPVLPVVALSAQAELHEKSNDLPAAALIYQELLEKHGNVVYQFQASSALKAGLYARARLNELILKNPASYAPIAERAKAALAEAGKDEKKLAAVVAKFPNSAGGALLALARIELATSADRARLSALRYLNQKYGTATGGTADALAILATACERINLTYAAREALIKLSGEEFKDAKISLENIDAKAGAGTVPAVEWARSRLKEPTFTKPLGQSVFAMGKLSKRIAWSRPTPENTVSAPLLPEGVPPVEMRRALFSIENGTDILALAGRDGHELWKPRPAAPLNPGRAYWYERLLIVTGEKSIVAYDSADNGNVAWKLDLNLDGTSNGIDWSTLAGGRMLALHSGNALEAFDANSGAKLWRSQLANTPLQYAPACGENYAVLTGANSNKIVVFDLETGNSRWSASVDGLSAAPIAFEDRVYAAGAKKLMAFDARSGKKICPDIALSESPAQLAANGEYVFAQGRKDIDAYRIDPNNPVKAWSVSGSPDNKANANLFNISEFLVDGDELLVAGVWAQTKAELASYSVRKEGYINWKCEIAIPKTEKQQEQELIQQQFGGNGIVVMGGGRVVINGRVQGNAQNAPPRVTVVDVPTNWLRENAARDHILVMLPAWDSGSMARVAAQVDRATGLLAWDVDLKGEQANVMEPSRRPRMQLFEGGVAVIEGRGRTVYTAPNAAGEEDEYKSISEQAAKNPEDVEARLKLATADYDRGEKAKSLATIADLLSGGKLDPKQFSTVYTRYSRLRNEMAAASHTTLTFKRVEKAPDVAGGDAGWEGIAAQEFGGWKDIFLASEDQSTRTQAKKELWRGPDDLKASFKGAYDKENIYIQVAVTDDKHNNTTAEATRIDFGDALTLAFDIGLSGGRGWRGETFLLALGLNKDGKATGVRRVEHAQFLRGEARIEKNFSVTRKEDARLTLYQIALPLSYLGLKADSDKPFGFNFTVRDQDAGNEVEKSLSSSPGQMGTAEPQLFSRGTLEKK